MDAVVNTDLLAADRGQYTHPVQNNHHHHHQSHLRTGEYTYRVPTPPRIVVPPPSLSIEALNGPELTAPQHASFLANISYDNLAQSSLLNWDYEKRREAQAILPFLYLGPLSAAKDKTYLRREGITMLLGVRQNHGSFGTAIMNTAVRVAEELGIEKASVDVSDNRELVSAFTTVNATINQHLMRVHQLHESGRTNCPAMGKVLVFCESGNERAAVAVAAYLMEMHEQLDYIRAMQVCQSRRFSVNFDDTLKRLLQSYWDLLTARRDVAASNVATSAPNVERKAKRALERDNLDDDDDRYDDEHQDLDMVDDTAADDEERFHQRRFAPFVDISF